MPDFGYLLSCSEPWLQHAIRLNLMGGDKESLDSLGQESWQDDKIKALLKDVENFHGTLVTNHKNPDLPVHKLLFLLEIGMDPETPEIRCAIEAIMEHKDENGVYQSRINVPRHFGGSGEDTFGWCLCDAPWLLLVLLKAGVGYEEQIKPGVEYLASCMTEQGFPCRVSRELGKFRGPGRKEDCCPYATLIMLRLFSEIPEYQKGEYPLMVAERLMSLWENSLQIHPYLFYMGTDFRKLKAPTVWYDIVSVADVLSRFEHVRKDKRFTDMLSIILQKKGKQGLFTPESIYQKYNRWDFGQKKAPSPYLTYLCERIFQRVGQ